VDDLYRKRNARKALAEAQQEQRQPSVS